MATAKPARGPRLRDAARQGAERRLQAKVGRYFSRVIAAAPDSTKRVALRENSDARAIDLLLRQAVPDLAGDPLAAARLRGFEQKERLLERAGGALTVMQAAELLGTSRQAVNKAIKAGRLLAYADKQGHYRLPTCQFAGREILPGLAETLRALPMTGFWSRLSFLTASDPLLGGKDPVASLRAGRIADVLTAARHFGGEAGG